MRKIILVLLLSLPSSLWAQGTLGLRFEGGLSWMWGGGLEGAGPKTETAIQPQVCAGLFYSCNPAFRLGVEYSYTRMLREQTQANLLSLPDGGVKGDVYRDLKTNFHTLGVTVEANLLGHRSRKTPLSLYAGTGIGCLFAFGNTYTLGVSNSFKPDGSGNTVHVTGQNERHNYFVPCIPATLSLEYLLFPQVALRISSGYRFVLAGDQDLSPKGQVVATVGLCFQLK